MLEILLDFFSEKARGLILTITGASIGSIAGAIEQTPGLNSVTSGYMSNISLEILQKLVFIASLIVATLTIISYLYKFYRWCKDKGK